MLRSWRRAVASVMVAALGAMVSTPAVAAADPPAPPHDHPAPTADNSWGENQNGFEFTIVNQSSKTLYYVDGYGGGIYYRDPIIYPHTQGTVKGMTRFFWGGGPGDV